jgi:Macrocin-O-methyltransferase (TylF)
VSSRSISALVSFIRTRVPRSYVSRLLLGCPWLYRLVRYESQLAAEQVALIAGLLGGERAGNVIECGVYRAGTTVFLARQIKRLHLKKKIYALDSFAGFEAEIEDEIRRGLVAAEGRTAFTANSVDYVRRKLAVLGVDDVVEVVPGYFEATLPRVEDRFCLALIDCDLEKSTEFCLHQLWPKVVDGGYVVVDDYAYSGYPGAALASDRFFREVPYARRSVEGNFLIVQK